MPSFDEESFSELAVLTDDPGANPFWPDETEGARMFDIVKGGMISPWDGVFYGGISGSCRLISPDTPFDYGQGGSAASCKITWHPRLSPDSFGQGVHLWASSPKARAGVRIIAGGGLIADHNRIL